MTDLFAAQNLRKTFGALTATDDVSFTLNPGDRLGLIGPNGAGKSTLMAQLSGFLAPDSGQILWQGQDITSLGADKRAQLGLARSFQITSVFSDQTALDNVTLALQIREGRNFRLWGDARRETAINDKAMHLLAQVGLQDVANRQAGILAHGQQKALELAMTLAGDPAVLLLDEPMAGLGAAESERMTALLASLPDRIALLLVEHDMDAVFALSNQLAVLVNGAIIAKGDPETVRKDKQVIAAYLGEDA